MGSYRESEMRERYKKEVEAVRKLVNDMISELEASFMLKLYGIPDTEFKLLTEKQEQNDRHTES